MPNFYIEQDIPIPRKRTGGRPVKYHALRTMQIGESIFVPHRIILTGSNASLSRTAFQDAVKAAKGSR